MRSSETVLFSLALSLCAVCATILAGCGGGSIAHNASTIEPSAASGPAVVVPASAILTAGEQFQFSANVSGSPVPSPIWLVDGVAGGSAATGTVDSSGLYTAPTGTLPAIVSVAVTDSSKTLVSTSARVSLFSATKFQPGSVSGTGNPLVALYSFPAPRGSTVAVTFGTTTSYGLSTWSRPAPAGGGKVNILVAGMRAETTYHMQAVVTQADGSTVKDLDQTFTTGPIPADMLPSLDVQTTPGITPADGVELLDLFQDKPPTNQLTTVVTDLDGNVIWYFPIQPEPPFPVKPLPNGDMLVMTSDLIREIDLAGNVRYSLPFSTLQDGLTAAGITFPNLIAFHHDILKLDNGHLVFLIQFRREDLPNVPAVVGDAIVDWDPQAKAVAWMWNTFDHLDLSHAPDGLADWTHANALVYSPDDGNLLLSMRNQNWVLKIKYADGKGDGSVLWRLGLGGDFTLPAGVGPIEWNYGQHYPVFLGPNTSGIYPLMFFNNGSTRDADADDLCGTSGFPACYSSVPVFQINENDKTIQILSERSLSPAYSICCGSVVNLSNGNLEYDIAFDIGDPGVPTIQEVTNGGGGQLAWQMKIHGELAYRGFRIPSLYPGVTWTQAAQATATSAARKVKRAAASSTAPANLQNSYIPRAQP